uniref:Uncharacterized protein n=1 Tax=Strigamia maritima TaxID=126957 RepID=T1ITV0_STRMM
MSTSVLKKCLNLEDKIHSEKPNTKLEKLKSKRKNNDIRSLTDEGQKIRKIDHIEENVKLLTRSNDNSIKINSILDHHQGRLLKNQPKIRKMKKKQDEPTVYMYGIFPPDIPPDVPGKSSSCTPPH